MDRKRFMMQLESLLQNITPAERQEALQYYNDYFDEAGPENEQLVIAELGTPARVAANIKRDLFGYGENARVNSNTPATLNGMKGEEADGTGQSDRTDNSWNGFTSQTMPQPAGSTSKGTQLPGWAIALIVVGLICAFPVLIGVVGVLAGIVAVWFSLIIALGTAAVALLAVLLLLVIMGILTLFVEPWAGLSMLGAGLVCGALGLLSLVITVWMAGKATPAVCKGISSLFRRKAVQ